MSSAGLIIIHIVCMCLISSYHSTRAQSDSGLSAPLPAPIFGFWFGDKYVKCPVPFEDFFKCCHKSKCTKNAQSIYDCCSGSTKRPEQIGEDELAKCVIGIGNFVKQQCKKEDKDFCPYDDGLSVCCTRPPCNMKEMKKKYCCK